MSLYSVVVPVYNSEHTLTELYTRLEKVFRETVQEPFELILVDDGSKDRSYQIMEKLRQKDPRVKIIQMARNFGQHPALLCGFSHAEGDFIITMDDDLQHPPEEIPKLINTIRERAMWMSSSPAMKAESTDRSAVSETNTYLPQIGNLLVLSSNRIINVPVHHDARAYGKSGYSFRRLVRDLLYDITSHSAFPLLLVRDLGICSFLVSVALGIFFLIRYFLYGISVEGWTSLMLVLLAFFGITLLSIGIMGIYLMNILNESKKMPHYVIRRKDV